MTPVDMGGLIYFSNSALPSRFANGVHVMKMCAALGRSTPPSPLVRAARK